MFTNNKMKLYLIVFILLFSIQTFYLKEKKMAADKIDDEVTFEIEGQGFKGKNDNIEVKETIEENRKMKDIQRNDVISEKKGDANNAGLEVENQEINNESVNDDSDDSTSVGNMESSKSPNNTSINLMSAKSTSLTLKSGDRHVEVIQLKKDLNKLGFSNFKNPNNYYASQTERAIKDFQKYYGLKSDGIAGPITLNKVKEQANSPFQSGKRHKDTIQLKLDLNELGYSNFKAPNNLFAKQTKAAVEKFQQRHGLRVTGIVEEVTMNKIKSELKKVVDPNNLKSGDRHSKVIQLKKDLNKLGFSDFKNPNNYYASQTEKAVKEFQTYYNLSVDGVAGPATFTKIEQVLGSPFQSGKRHKDTIQLKKDLTALGFANFKSPTNYYAAQTKAAVEGFQGQHGLPISGIAEEITMKTVKSEVNKIVDPNNLKSGDRHSSVIQLKKDLNKLGFSNFKNPNNYYGSLTEKAVKDFQRYYNISITGIANLTTLNKINEQVNSPFQSGKRHEDTIQLKKDLTALGFANFKSPTNYYAAQTKAAVENFQQKHGLPISGIAEEITMKKIKELVDNTPTTPENKTEYTDYKLTLNKALDIQMSQKTIITDKYKNDPAYVSAQYIKLDGEATIVASGVNVNIRTGPNTTSSIAFQVSKGYKINITDEVHGTSVSGSTLWYEFKEGNNVYYVHSSLVSTNSGTVTANVNVRANSNTSSHIYGKLTKGTKVTIIEKGTNWHKISYSGWRNPTRSDMESYLNPDKNNKMQHLRLDSSVGVTAAQLNKVLTNKGILAGKGQAFINGTRKYGVNEAYLIAHAQLETGNGTSTLAKGVKYNGKTVYNMYGIGAIDSDPLNGGAKTAYENGWFTPEAAIEGGAEWIAKQYIQNQHKQNTLYKMKWNPNMATGYAWKQYATDIAWAVKQIPQIKNIYDQLDNPTYHYDIAKYR